MKRKIIFIFGIVFLVLAFNFVNAGVINPYWETRPLEMGFGETRTINFKLTNIGSEDITYSVEIKKGQDIVTLEKTSYVVKAGTEDTQVPLTITIPEDYDRQVQKVELLFTEVTPGQQGMVSLSTGYIGSFNVVLSKGAVAETSSIGIIIALIIALIVVLVLIFVLVKRKRK